MKKRSLIYLAIVLILAALLFATSSEWFGQGNDRAVQDDVMVTPVPIALEPARAVEGITVALVERDHSSILTDGNLYSMLQFSDFHGLSIESEEGFSSLYLIWDAAPGEYKICWDAGEVSCGKDGFIHEYVRLSDSVNRVWFEFESDHQKLLCDVAAYTEGAAPDGVQEWLPPCETADILVFPVHSDDEALFFGPLIAYYAIERELSVQTAFMVDHSLETIRNHERLNGLWELGVRNYPVLGDAPDNGTYSFQDAMIFYADDGIDAWQIEQIRRFRPLVVVGHDFAGEYGNGGHQVSAYYLTQMIEAAGDAERYPESSEVYGVWDVPKYYVHLYKENRIVLEVDTPLVNDSEGRTAYEIAVDSYDLYKSQHQYFPYIRRGVGYDRYDPTMFGLYRSTVGADTGADIMENIDPDFRTEKQLSE